MANMISVGLLFDGSAFPPASCCPMAILSVDPSRSVTIRSRGRTCRITFSRSEEKEPGTDALPNPPPFAGDNKQCPFCPENIATHTPQLDPDLCLEGRLVRGRSTLFPNLFPYGCYSAVSLFDENHFVEIGTASHRSYSDSFLNCRDYLKQEQTDVRRFIGQTGPWHWICAFAPEGFFEIWGILPEVTDFRELENDDWQNLVSGVLNAQQFYRSLGRNGYNLGLILFADGSTDLELRVVLMVRSNYAPWVRSDLTGFEVMLVDMATFTEPEQTAEQARPFWRSASSQ